ncbi:AraC family transcriptional regulator [Pedobacter sp. JCM 36344]|uniref:AraC family transcriptional regulator n=1 Tax=Pedobacter sp. JCM 36344 TaxID=3374280 RepID=UPI00397CFF73
MKVAIHKSAIPETQMFVVKELEERHFDPTWHAHSEYQLFVVLEGTGTRFIGDSIKSFHAGELVFTGADIPHLWRSDDLYFKKNSNQSIKGIVIYLQENFLGDHMMEKEELVLLKKFFKRSSRGLEFYGERKQVIISMMQDLLLMNGLESLIQLLKILLVVSQTKEYNYISNTKYTGPFNENETDRMNKVYEYALKNFRKKISLPELSAMLYMTPTSFSRYFSIRNNKTFSRFITELRVKHACKLLMETDLPISTISYDCGFNTLSNFNKQFKEVMFKKPSDYKNEYLKM